MNILAGKDIKRYIGQALTLFLFVILCYAPMPAHAEKLAAILPEATCTNQPQFEIENVTIISDIAGKLSSITTDTAMSKFGSVAGSASGVITGALQLYVLMYGLLFMFGAVQRSFYDVAIRLAKVAVVGMTMAGSGEVQQLLKDIFVDGTNEIMNAIGCTVTGASCSSASSLPLSMMDEFLSIIASPKMVVTIITIATTGVYGAILFLLLVVSIKSFAEAMLNALWVYALSSIVRTIMIAIGPIFIPCILFTRTRDYFQGWLNQLVNASLQPILLMTFFAFFLGLMQNLLGELFKTPICLTPMTDIANGASVNGNWWRFTKNNQQYTGDWEAGDGFPIDMFTILMIFILGELVGRFNSVVLSIANGLSGASTNFQAMSGVFSNWESALGGAGNQVEAAKDKARSDAGRINDAVNPGGGSASQGTTNVGRRPSTGGELAPQGGATQGQQASAPGGVGAGSGSSSAASSSAPAKRDTKASSTARAMAKMAEMRRDGSFTPK